MSICHLAWEVISYIAHELDVDDLFNLSLSCRQLQGLIRDNNICKRVLQSVAPCAPETKSAHRSQNYARALRVIFKRRNAISSASPYLVAICADAESFLYSNGVLCYINRGLLGVRDLHNSAPTEEVIDIGKLLNADQLLSRTVKAKLKYELRILNYSNGFVSCWYIPKDSPDSWLIVISPSQGRWLSHALTSSRKIFVRNNDRYLYYGTHCDIAEDGSRRWALRGCNLLQGKWHGYSIHLPEMVGSEIDINICFEIIDGYFYGLANQALFEREEIRWTSYYTCVRFPIDQAKPKSTQLGTMKELWRKFHSEGPIDHRWNFIKLSKDECTGALTIVEGRREWRAGASASRTYYTSELCFASQDNGSVPPPSGLPTANDPATHLAPSTTCSVSTEHSSCGPLDADDDEAPTSRSPHLVHPGDNAATLPLLALNNSLLRCYHSSCQTYLDLVDQSLPGGDSGQRQGIKLRVGSRSLRSRSDPAPPPTSADENPLYPDQQIRRLYKSEELKLWPPECWCSDSQTSRDLYEILNPQTQGGDFEGMWDDRSICYAKGGLTKTIVLISFDPSIRLPGTRSWWSSGLQGEKDAPDQHFAAVGASAIVRTDTSALMSLHTNGPHPDFAPLSFTEDPQRNRYCADSVEESCQSGELMGTNAASSKASLLLNSEPQKPRWTWTAHSAHAGIQKGFHFAL